MSGLPRIFSPSQKEAISHFGEDVCVSAAAGSGKTTILVERFLHAVVDRGVDPSRILAITYTEKAANEMKARLVALCRERGLADIRRALESSYVGTIHGFCSKILKENPIESGIDPSFRVLGEGETEILANKVLDRLFEEEGVRPGWIQLLSELGERPVRSAVRSIAQLRRIFPDREVLRAPSAGDTVDLERARQAVEDLVGTLAGKKLTDAEVRLQAVLGDLRDYLKGRPRPDWDWIREALDRCKSLSRKIPRHKESVDHICAEVLRVAEALFEKIAQPVKKEFIALCDLFAERFDREKKALAAYDFEDLLYRVYKLLSDEDVASRGVRERLREHFLAVMVDEYQDTSPLQDRIIGLIARPSALFLVGDLRQSIYGFRHAEPDVFKARMEPSAPDEGVRNVALSENYRSREAILNFVNAFFERMDPVQFSAPVSPRRSFAETKGDCIDLVVIPAGRSEGLNADEARVIEASAIARLIRSWVDSGVRVERDGRSQPLRYRDIAVLMRSTGQSALYEKALSDRGVPYYAVKGKGFYDKPEVMDLVNLLRIIENPRQDIALASVLRSPLVSISDDALFWLGRRVYATGKGSFYSGFRDFRQVSELSGSDRSRLERFEGLFEELRASKNRSKISRLLEHALRKTSFEAKLLLRTDGVQRVANVRKLIETAHQWEETGVYGIEDFTGFLRTLSERELLEPEAKIHSEDSDAVTILTVHAAKGLEFPYVIVANMGQEPYAGGEDAFVCGPDGVVGVKLPDPMSALVMKDAAYVRYEERCAVRNREEEARLLYVAMTRAKEHLVLSGHLPPPPRDAASKKITWMHRLAGIVGADAATLQDRTFLFAGVPVRRLGLAGSAEEAKDVRAAAEVSQDREALIRQLTQMKPSGESEDFLKELESRFLPVLKDFKQTQDVTVTDLLVFSSGAPSADADEIEPEERVFSADAEEGLARNEYGTLFHGILEALARRRPPRITKAFVKPYLTPALSAAQSAEIEASVMRFWKGPWGAKVRAARRVYPELPFIYKTGSGLLKGQIDLVLQEADGSWTILDYKTNRFEDARRAEVAAGYEWQLALYALVFHRLFGEAPKRGVLYFSVDGSEHGFCYNAADLAGFEERMKKLHERFVSTEILGSSERA